MDEEAAIVAVRGVEDGSIICAKDKIEPETFGYIPHSNQLGGLMFACCSLPPASPNSHRIHQCAATGLTFGYIQDLEKLSNKDISNQTLLLCYPGQLTCPMGVNATFLTLSKGSDTKDLA